MLALPQEQIYMSPESSSIPDNTYIPNVYIVRFYILTHFISGTIYFLTHSMLFFPVGGLEKISHLLGF